MRTAEAAAEVSVLALGGRHSTGEPVLPGNREGSFGYRGAPSTVRWSAAIMEIEQIGAKKREEEIEQ